MEIFALVVGIESSCGAPINGWFAGYDRQPVTSNAPEFYQERMSVRAILLRAGSLQPEWVEIDGNASGPELSALISSSQPECLTLTPDLLMWTDGTPFCKTSNEIGRFMIHSVPHAHTGDVLLVGSHDPRDNAGESSESSSGAAFVDVEWHMLVSVFTAEFLEKLQ